MFKILFTVFLIFITFFYFFERFKKPPPPKMRNGGGVLCLGYDPGYFMGFENFNLTSAL
jgi:hypothetical protein